MNPSQLMFVESVGLQKDFSYPLGGRGFPHQNIELQYAKLNLKL